MAGVDRRAVDLDGTSSLVGESQIRTEEHDVEHVVAGVLVAPRTGEGTAVRVEQCVPMVVGMAPKSRNS